jgi:uncharacterized small protein (DUF1192 family)
VEQEGSVAGDDDDRPQRKIVHELGQDLSLLSVNDLEARIAALEAEIARLKADMARKRASRDAASAFFKS